MKREEIYQAIWATPMTKLSKELGVSGSYLTRVCEILNVPRPGRGYWAKLQAGANMKVPALPPQRFGEPLEWSKEGGYQGTQRFTESAPEPSEPRQKRRASGTGTHALINGARKHFESGRPASEGALGEGIFLKPYKKLLVDITTSSPALVRALSVSNELFNSLELRGFRVAIAPHAGGLSRPGIDWHEIPKEPRSYYPTIWKPSRPTVVYVGEIAIGIAILEMAESVLMRYVGGDKYIRDSDYIPPKLRRGERDWSWTTNKDRPTGRFRLQLYAPYHHVSWTRHWQETETDSLESQIPSIVNEMRAMGDELSKLVLAADRKEELRRQEWERELELIDRRDDRLEAKESREQSRASLIKLIRMWERAESTRRFFESIEVRLGELPEEMREEVSARIALAKEFAKTSSPWDVFLDWRTPTELYAPRYPRDDSEE
ncbi:hypothetical protein ABZR86_01995 [Dyella marensis]|uniref:Uncharacterized protein n=1 Tax=Dyella marensis TaxID=500610 RepID=A0A1I2ACY2_9GAMM|nr:MULTISPECIES: hypothetical protein [Dyella]SFE40690.1 hypothetical protein SAMN02799615_00971 [Dyella marensis]